MKNGEQYKRKHQEEESRAKGSRHGKTLRCFALSGAAAIMPRQK